MERRQKRRYEKMWKMNWYSNIKETQGQIQRQGIPWCLVGSSLERRHWGRGEKMYSTDCERRVEEFKAKSAKIPKCVKKRSRRRRTRRLRCRTRAKCSEAPAVFVVCFLLHLIVGLPYP